MTSTLSLEPVRLSFTDVLQKAPALLPFCISALAVNQPHPNIIPYDFFAFVHSSRSLDSPDRLRFARRYDRHNISSCISHHSIIGRGCPATLECMARHRGIALFRLICKQTSEAGIKAVTGYLVRLAPQASVRMYPEPLLEVGKLLRNSNLQRLHVEVELTRSRDGSASADDSMYRTAQLNHFTSAIGTALNNITSLNFMATGTDTRITDKYYDEPPPSVTVSEYVDNVRNPWAAHVSDMEGATIAGLLSHACPLIENLGVGGDVGLPSLKVLGDSCPLINSWECLDAGVPVATLQSVFRNGLFPKISTVRLFEDLDSELLLAEPTVLALLQNASLTDLDASRIRLGEACWEKLPSGLRILHLSHIDKSHIDNCCFPSDVHLGNLRHLDLNIGRPNLSTLATILEAAPLLQKISGWKGSHKRSDGLIITNLTPPEMKEMHMLSQRLEAGLELDLMRLRLEGAFDYDRADDALLQAHLKACSHVKEMFQWMPCLPGFKRCEINHKGTTEEQQHAYQHRQDSQQPLFGRDASAPTDNLSHIARVLPDVTHLCVRGMVFTEAEVLKFSAGRVLQQLYLVGLQRFSVDVTALVRLVITIPSLRQLLHDASYISTEELQHMLSKARALNTDGEDGLLSGSEMSNKNDVWEVDSSTDVGRKYGVRLGSSAFEYTTHTELRGWYRQGFLIEREDFWFREKEDD